MLKHFEEKVGIAILVTARSFVMRIAGVSNCKGAGIWGGYFSPYFLLIKNKWAYILQYKLTAHFLRLCNTLLSFLALNYLRSYLFYQNAELQCSKTKMTFLL
jgi:hypothetical protein